MVFYLLFTQQIINACEPFLFLVFRTKYNSLSFKSLLEKKIPIIIQKWDTTDSWHSNLISVQMINISQSTERSEQFVALWD